jgi:hypothetical protein
MAIMGDELSETRGGSVDIFGGASIIVAQTFNPERFRGQLSACKSQLCGITDTQPDK